MTFESQLSKQYGGKHYKGAQLQPVEIAYRNKLCFRIFSSLKYLFRHNKDGGEGSLDIKKAIHYLQFLLEQEYDVRTRIEYSDEYKTTNEHKSVDIGEGGLCTDVTCPLCEDKRNSK